MHLEPFIVSVGPYMFKSSESLFLFNPPQMKRRRKWRKRWWTQGRNEDSWKWKQAVDTTVNHWRKEKDEFWGKMRTESSESFSCGRSRAERAASEGLFILNIINVRIKRLIRWGRRRRWWRIMIRPHLLQKPPQPLILLLLLLSLHISFIGGKRLSTSSTSF